MSIELGPGVIFGPGVRIDPLLTYVSTNLQLYYDPSTYTSGSTLNDLSGNDFTGTLTNIDSTNYADSYFTYNGASSTILTPDMTSAFNSTLAVTYEVWASPTNVGCCVLETGHAVTLDGWYDNQMEVGGDAGPPWALYTSLWNGGNFSGVGTTPNIQTGQWYQFVLTYTGTSGVGTAYVNGVSVGVNPLFTRSAPWIDGGVGYYLHFGESSPTVLYSGNWFEGRMGIIRAYDRGLSAAEVLQNFNATRGIYGI